MNRHQILTGACNGGDCYALGSVEGVNFVAYASGCDIVILASNFQRVVTIPGVLRGNIKVSCVDCSTDTGKIAASFGKKVHIFEPTPSNTETAHKLDYRWFPTAELEADCFVRCLSWNVEGSRLLTGGDVLQMWEFVTTNEAAPSSAPPGKVQFQLGSGVGDDEDPVTQRLVHAIADPDYITDHQFEQSPGAWECIWKTKPSAPVTHLKYSPDSFVFASLGKNERLVKIWYEDQKVSHGLMRHDSMMSAKKNAIHYTFIYISHPRAVTGFEWRKTSKYMPRGSVANMLVTCCEDNVCRIFVETILPDAGLLDLEQFDPAMSVDPKYHTQRHKKRFVQRLKNIRQAIHKRRKHPRMGSEGHLNGQNLPNSSSVHDFHKFAIHHNGVSPVLHFHLACSINPETDIPLLPIVGNKEDVENNFRLHWLNNKDLEFTMEAEKLLQELHQRLIAEEGGAGSEHTPNQTTSEDDHSLIEEDEEEESSSGPLRKNLSKKSRLKEKGIRNTASHSSLSSAEDGEREEQHNDFPIHLLQTGVIDRLDRKIDALLLDWHSSPDYVFSIHPADGSYLVWLIDHLDESTPFTFHQAQASFSSRLPRAFPIPDARSMASNLLIYCNYNHTDIKTMMKMSESLLDSGGGNAGEDQDKHSRTLSSSFEKDVSVLIPSINMVTKHSNGTLNQWQVTFSENSKFQNIVSVSHSARACGHRFRTNSAACHPVLPLLLTTSHHNMPTDSSTPQEPPVQTPELQDMEQVGPTFCSELILWQVMPVGPLSKSGGISELCRINNSCQSAFTSVAWVPTLLPSTCLGSYSNSPSALFVASDGQCLRLFQAVIDARSLLMETSSYLEAKQSFSNISTSSSSSYHEVNRPPKQSVTDLFNIVSLQSSTKPGCVLELDAISDAVQDWQNIQLLHVYQEQLVTGEERDNAKEAVVDLSGQQTFDENFFLLVVEKLTDGSSMLHMWKLTIDSQPSSDGQVNGSYDWNTYENMVDSYNDDLSPDGLNYSSVPKAAFSSQIMTMSVKTTKVCTHKLPLPDDVEVISAAIAGGHLSSASIYPACYAPYQFVTACSDGEIRFWKCSVTTTDHQDHQTSMCSVTSYEFALEEGDVKSMPHVHSRKEEQLVDCVYRWTEWERPCSSEDKSSSVQISGRPIAVSCAYSGRIAVAYRSGPIRTQTEHPEDKYVNLRVVILECESTGGSEWVQEDVIELNNIRIPDPKNEIDMCMLQTFENPQLSDSSASDALQFPAAETAAAFMTRTKSVPSLSTIQSVRRSIQERGNKKGLLQQKSLVQLDWASCEDGSHLLTVAVGSKVLIYGQVSNEIAKSLKSLTSQEVEKTHEEKRVAFASSKMLTLNKSVVSEAFKEEIKWMRLKGVELHTADGLPPLPMHISWVRTGILVVGMDNEMQVFTQWRSDKEDVEVVEDEATMDKRTLTEANLVTAASSLNLCNNYKSKSNFKTSVSHSNFKHAAQNSTKKDSWKKSNQTSATSKGSVSLARSDSISSLPMLYDSGLFEAARFANPVLPQYHPKLLMELLNFGKTNRVKAILAHLVRCISGGNGVQYTQDTHENGQVRSPRQRNLSTRSLDGDAEGGGSINYAEIKSIPPLPLYALIAADKDAKSFNSDVPATASQTKDVDYNDLLNTFNRPGESDDDEEFENQLLSTSADSNSSNPTTRRRNLSTSKLPTDPYTFGMSQSSILKEYLFKLTLPGLSGNDQYFLAALSEVVGSSSLDFSDVSHVLDPDRKDEQGQGSCDDCGLRFLLAMKQYQCLIMTLPPLLRGPLMTEGIRTYHLVWAFHSESTQEVLQAIPCVKSEEPTWQELKLYGVGWWVKNMIQLRTLILQVANHVFKKTKDPMTAAIYYLAMKKKNVLKGLFRTVQNKKMEQFFGLDFSNENNQRIAMKNAYHLLGKGEFQNAAAFFFLAGQVQNAVSVILDKMNDLQLALVLCRLYDGESMTPESVRTLYYEKILGLDANGENYESRNASSDPFLRSMALWQLNDYESSLQTLLEKNVGRVVKSDPDNLTQIPKVFNFYNFLRTHPLITRLRIASSSQQQRTQLVSGFTHVNSVVSQDVTTLDRVTPSERQLFFAAAHAHFQNGCPLVAIEVMRKLPNKPLLVDDDLQRMEYFAKRRRKSLSEINISTGTLKDTNIMSMDNGANETPSNTNNVNGDSSENKAENLFSTPVANGGDTASSINWGAPSSNLFGGEKANAINWGAPSRVHFEDDLDLELDLGLGSGSSDEEDKEGEEDGVKVNGEESSPTKEDDVFDSSTPKKEIEETGYTDIMAQQYKFIACLKVLMEELANLATGFEVDGGQLRHQLYIWLEKELEVLRLVCNYGTAMEQATGRAPLDSSGDEGDGFLDVETRGRTQSDLSVGKASLHEVFKADKQDLQSKVARMTRRKAWLKSNQHLLRTLSSYCVLQGSAGGGLASVHMELLLLLQELQQERPQQQLLSPLPFPTTLPLLSASITSSRSVIADPIRYLQFSVQDLLHAVIEMGFPPNANTDIGLVSTIRDLAVALSSCIYQSLCDSDTFSVTENIETGIDGFINPEFSYPSSHLMAGVKKSRPRHAGGEDEVVNTPPAKWPGVASLKVLLAREKDEDSPKIHILLTESLIAVYMSLLISAMSMYDPQMLYRLVANKLDAQTWATLFGGGNKMAVRTEKSSVPIPQDVSKHRMTFNLKVMAGSPGSSQGPNKSTIEVKETYQEKFVPPELSMINYFMTKPFVGSSECIIDYDSEDSVVESDLESSDEYTDDDDDTYRRPTSLSKKAKDNTEHIDSSSYSWSLLRLATIKSVRENFATFLPQIGIELSELPNVSPSLHAVMKVLEQWEELLKSRINLFSGAPENYIPGLMLSVTSGQPRTKFEALMQADNTPFINGQATLPIKRLWFQLMKQESLKDTFLRYIFRKKKDPEDSENASMKTSSSENDQQVKDPMKIIHKEQDIITSFSINQANTNLLALSTQKEIVELDIGYLLKPPTWLDDENEFDIELLRNPNPGPDNPDFLVVQTPQDTPQPVSGTGTPSTPYIPSPGALQGGLQTGRGTSVILRRPVLGVRRIGSHPVLPHYLTGGADGAVRLWEWGHGQPITTLRQPGSFPKVTKVLFNAQGNKCCVSDVEGSICLWQVGLGSNYNKPIMSLQCHNKTTSDFQFVGSSSLIATAGQSSEHKNVCLWDTLLPVRSSLIHAFQCHEQGSPAVVYASRQHLLISGGRKGEVCIFDLRQRVLKHTFQAHEAPIKCLALDPDEDYFITGSAEGDIKVWGLKIHQLIFSFPGEHSKTTFFKNVGSTSGVAQVTMGPHNHLFSCGVDGSMKFRQLPERELVMHHWA